MKEQVEALVKVISKLDDKGKPEMIAGAIMAASALGYAVSCRNGAWVAVPKAAK